MKKLIAALILGFFLAPFPAWGQKWIESYTAKDGTWVPGHWQSQAEVRQNSFATPGKINPYTGQFTPYSGKGTNLPSAAPPPATAPPFDPFIPPNYQQDYRYKVK